LFSRCQTHIELFPTNPPELGIAKSFDFVLTSSKAKAEKPGKGIFDEALKLGACSSPKAAFHVGDSIRTDVAGALAAGWTPLRYNEWFDEEFPDWTDIETEQTAQDGAERGQAALQWGRREVETGLEWVEIWGLDDVLSLFGFPEDEEKLIKTTLLKGVYED
jgi:FMN phosphatase YigB (HAD superfamily)